MNNIYSHTITEWYLQNKRDLPWRDTRDPYLIWISEIILQQTRVAQGLSYYLRFIKRFPDIESLACADEEEILKYWQGLGYYSRARNLHKAARKIMSEFDGKFPAGHDLILKLNGIGEYTAAAISSFAYNMPYATIDGNVYRVLSRLFAIKTPIDTNEGKKEFAKLAQELLWKEEPGLHNQAMMEFGALHCVPVSPDCIKCPLQNQCRAYELNEVANLPVKSQKAKVSNRYYNYLFIIYNGNTFIEKRTANDVWRNLYQFPLIETEKLLNVDELAQDERFTELFKDIKEVNIRNVSSPVKHVLSHRNIFAQFITIQISESNDVLDKYLLSPMKEIDKYPVSRLMELFLEKAIQQPTLFPLVDNAD